MYPLKHIIFDLGAVLYDIDFVKTDNAFKKLGFHQFDEMYTQYHVDEVFEKLEIGTITEEDFCKTLIAKNEQAVTSQQIIDAWNAILIGWRRESIEKVKALTSKYDLYLLSNTNTIHQKDFMKSFAAEFDQQNFNTLFTKAYYSHEINLRKPTEAIFKYVLNDAGIESKHTLFIDDSYPNIDTAKAMGFKTRLLLPGERIEALDFNSF
jgi:glucose-1-phosphatase